MLAYDQKHVIAVVVPPTAIAPVRSDIGFTRIDPTWVSRETSYPDLVTEKLVVLTRTIILGPQLSRAKPPLASTTQRLSHDCLILAPAEGSVKIPAMS